jgi:hypothetical protein
MFRPDVSVLMRIITMLRGKCLDCIQQVGFPQNSGKRKTDGIGFPLTNQLKNPRAVSGAIRGLCLAKIIAVTMLQQRS